MDISNCLLTYRDQFQIRRWKGCRAMQRAMMSMEKRVRRDIRKGLSIRNRGLAVCCLLRGLWRVAAAVWLLLSLRLRGADAVRPHWRLYVVVAMLLGFYGQQGMWQPGLSRKGERLGCLRRRPLEWRLSGRSGKRRNKTGDEKCT